MHQVAEVSESCGAQRLLQLLARPWTMDILGVLSARGPTRFGVLRRSVEGISARVLRERLRCLEEKKIVFRKYEPTIPPAVTYGLTARIHEVEKALGSLDRIVRRWEREDDTPAPSLATGPATFLIPE